MILIYRYTTTQVIFKSTKTSVHYRKSNSNSGILQNSTRRKTRILNELRTEIETHVTRKNLCLRKRVPSFKNTNRKFFAMSHLLFQMSIYFLQFTIQFKPRLSKKKERWSLDNNIAQPTANLLLQVLDSSKFRRCSKKHLHAKRNHAYKPQLRVLACKLPAVLSPQNYFRKRPETVE